MPPTIVPVHGEFAESAIWDRVDALLGATELVIGPVRLHAQFAADVRATPARRMAVTQRPVAGAVRAAG